MLLDYLFGKSEYYYYYSRMALKLGYILKSDIIAQLSEKTLNELTGGRKAIGDSPAVLGDDSIWESQLPSTIEFVAGYCRHWYDMDTEQRPILEHNLIDPFAVGDRIQDSSLLYICILDAPIGTIITNTTYFTLEDDRNPVLVECTVLLVVYNTFRRINPRQIPEQRQIDYDNTIGTLKDVQRGRIQLNIAERAEVLPDDPGHEVAYGDFEDVTQDTY